MPNVKVTRTVVQARLLAQCSEKECGIYAEAFATHCVLATSLSLAAATRRKIQRLRAAGSASWSFGCGVRTCVRLIARILLQFRGIHRAPLAIVIAAGEFLHPFHHRLIHQPEAKSKTYCGTSVNFKVSDIKGIPF